MEPVNESGEYAFVADLYDHVVPYRERADVEFFVAAAIESGGPILEVGCGTGRILLPVARAGVEITGLDSSPQMLDVCRRKLLDEPEVLRSRVRLIEADMRDFDLERQAFALATLPFRPFQHLTTIEEQISCLTSIRRHLVEGGQLILDLFNPSLEALVSAGDVGREVGGEPEFTMPDGRRVLRRHKIVSRDHFNQVSHVELIYHVTHRDGRKENLVHAFVMRHLFRFEAEHLLARCGFAVRHVYADYDKSLYGSKYPGELIFVAQKVSGRGAA